METASAASEPGDFRSLAAFSRWFLSQSFGALRVPQIPVAYMELATTSGKGSSVTGLVLYRRAPFQVELFAAHRNVEGSTFPEHRHPDVDSIEFFLSGEIAFTINGQRVAGDDCVYDIAPDGAHPLAGAKLSVRAKDWHGAYVSPNGGAFLSIQKWKHGVEPSSVTHNWIGPAHVSHSDTDDERAQTGS